MDNGNICENNLELYTSFYGRIVANYLIGINFRAYLFSPCLATINLKFNITQQKMFIFSFVLIFAHPRNPVENSFIYFFLIIFPDTYLFSRAFLLRVITG